MRVLGKSSTDPPQALYELSKTESAFRYGEFTKSVTIGTGCSGTDASVQALKMVLTAQAVDHVYAIDNWSASREFIKARASLVHCASTNNHSQRRKLGHLVIPELMPSIQHASKRTCISSFAFELRARGLGLGHMFHDVLPIAKW